MTKPRVQVDAFVIGAFMIIAALLVYKFPRIYMEGDLVRSIFDVVGFVVIIIGVLLRMSARGYKKFSSNQGCQLVTGGPYSCVRNPMYLGTFLIAIGFMCPLYPLWLIAVFTAVFYARFIIQIRKEEQWLKESFGQNYEDYCARVPRFIPTYKSLRETGIRQVFPCKHMWTTKEKFGLLFWPALNTVIELLQEKIMWGQMDYFPAVANIVIAVLLVTWAFYYQFREE